jgi:hypothetical protein
VLLYLTEHYCGDAAAVLRAASLSVRLAPGQSDAPVSLWPAWLPSRLLDHMTSAGAARAVVASGARPLPASAKCGSARGACYGFQV